jgi:hypothetical protein
MALEISICGIMSRWAHRFLFLSDIIDASVIDDLHSKNPLSWKLSERSLDRFLLTSPDTILKV